MTKNRKKYLAVGALIFAVLWIMLGPWYLSKISSFSSTGQIGDTIGGITAPIIGLVSAMLVYLSFNAQIEANEKQIEANNILKSQWEFDTYYKLYGEMEKAYTNDFRMTITHNNVNGTYDQHFYGASYIAEIQNHIKWHDEDEDDEAQSFLRSHIDSIEFVLEDIVVLIKYVQDSNVGQKHFFLYRIERFYSTRMEKAIDNLYAELPRTLQFSKSHNLHTNLKSILCDLRKTELKATI